MDRKILRTQITKLCNEVNETTNEETNELDLRILLKRLTVANENLRRANDTQAAPAESSALQREQEGVCEYEDKVAIAGAKLEFYIDQKRKTTSSSNSNSSATSSADVVTRLPRIELRTFSGNAKDWLPFWEQYKRAVHDNTRLDATSKFCLLQSHLRGRAAETINGFSPTEASYNDAIELLREEFGTSQRIVEAHLQTLTSLPRVSSPRDAVALRNLFTTVMTTMRSLQSLGVSTSQYSIILRSQLTASLPSSLQMQFHRQLRKNNSDEAASSAASTTSDGDDSHLQQLLDFIRCEVETLELCTAAPSATSSGESSHRTPVNSSSKTKKRHTGPAYTAAGLIASQSKNSPRCFLCEKPHATEECRAPLSIEGKKEKLREQRRCFRCTAPNHSSKRCNSSVKCSKCGGRHATTMCDPDWRGKLSTKFQPNGDTSSPSTSSSADQKVSTFAADKRDSHVFLQTACVRAANPNGQSSCPDLAIRVVVDGGSQITAIKESVSRQLNLPIVRRQKTAIITYGSNGKSTPSVCNVVEVSLRGQHNGSIVRITAIETPNICLDVLAVPDDRHSKLRHLQLADSRANGIEPLSGLSMLIGADQYYKVALNNFERLDENLTAVETKFGWTLHGAFGDPSAEGNVHNGLVTVLHAAVDFSDDDFDLRKMWSLESIGIKTVTERTDNDFEKTYAENSIERNEEGRYRVRLPFKDDRASIVDNNKQAAAGHLKRLTARLSKESGKLEQYDEEIRRLLTANFAEKAPPTSSNEAFFLPHRPVYRNDKATTKTRVVFNASSHRSGVPSLNDLMYTGPNLNPDILSALLNFRSGSIGVTADIEKAFLQIELQESERDFHRFLWYSDPISKTSTLSPVVEYRMCRVTFGVKASPFILSATIRFHLENYRKTAFADTCDVLQNAFYVDDLVLSVNDLNKAVTFYNEALSVMADARMTLRKWTTNSPLLRAHIEADRVANETVKVLGLVWNTRCDTLSIDIPQPSLGVTLAATKRVALQTLSQLFDPLGFVAPFLVKAKLLVQKAWKRKCDWEAPLPPDLLSAWTEWQRQLPQLNDFAITRHALHGDTLNGSAVQLHVFADASPSAFGCAAYLRTERECGEASSTLLCAKSRIAPVKDSDSELTLPKLELTAALLAARLANYIRTHFRQEISSVHLWSDSLIALFWIRGDASRWKPYVSNRAREIQSLTAADQWRHCPGADNPADLLTRGVKANDLLHSALWVTGPDWLKDAPNAWPTEQSSRRDVIEDSTALFASNTTPPTPPELPTPRLENFSQLRRLLRATAFLLRAQRNFRLPRLEYKTTPISVTELEEAERHLIRAVQREFFSNEISCLTQSKPLLRDSSLLTLAPFLDENGLLRLGGRLEELEEPFEVRHPILLPKASRLSQLIVMDSHYHRQLHAGVSSVLTDIRARFWIVRARQLVKSVVSSCVICKRQRGRPATEPMAPLPRDRITQSRPFEVTGVDFAGPLYVKSPSGQSRKTYVMLLTCGVVRAVHLELTPDLTTESCTSALRRFFSRRGVPRVIYSDNARTFKRASFELNAMATLIESGDVQELLRERRIEWRFIVERAAWWGGWWERLVRSVKAALKSALGKRLLDYDQLQTLLTEIEGVINSRPLHYVSDSPTDPRPLTPAHFLCGAPSVFLQPATATTAAHQHHDLRELWRSRQRILNVFCSRWSAHYLRQLRSAHHSSPAASSGLRDGDVVLVHDTATPRLNWKMGVVQRCFQGRDGKVRACEVKVLSGKNSATFLRRPVQHLYPLEINAN